MPKQRVDCRVMVVVVRRQRVDVDQSLSGQLNPLGEDAKLLHAGNHDFHRFTDPCRQIVQQLELDQLSFSGLGALFTLGTVISQRGPLIESNDGGPNLKSFDLGSRLSEWVKCEPANSISRIPYFP